MISREYLLSYGLLLQESVVDCLRKAVAVGGQEAVPSHKGAVD